MVSESMVFFTCNACGSSLKKNQVEKHYQSECPRCEVLSCMDCGRDFHGDEYASHTKCISEAEKYQGSLYRESGKTGGGGKGERKQQEWLERVQGLANGTKVNPRISRLLERIAQYSNIPRKRAKFENFVKNSVNVRDSKTLGELWDIFSTAIKPANAESGSGPIAAEGKNQSDAEETEMAVTENDESSQQPKKEKKKKKKNVEESMAVEPCDPPDIDSELSEAKIKKKARKSTADGETCDIDSEPSKKKTKKRKRKHKEEVEASNAEEEDNSTAQAVEGIEASYETKKKKKHKHTADGATTKADESILNGDMEHTKEKKKKRSKDPTDTPEKIEEYSVGVGPMEVAVEYINGHHSIDTIAGDSKTMPKKTKKKRKSETFAVDGEEIDGDMPAPKKQKKHKHKSASDF